jgi:hypothetical protein
MVNLDVTNCGGPKSASEPAELLCLMIKASRQISRFRESMKSSKVNSSSIKSA